MALRGQVRAVQAQEGTMKRLCQDVGLVLLQEHGSPVYGKSPRANARFRAAEAVICQRYVLTGHCSLSRMRAAH